MESNNISHDQLVEQVTQDSNYEILKKPKTELGVVTLSTPEKKDIPDLNISRLQFLKEGLFGLSLVVLPPIITACSNDGGSVNSKQEIVGINGGLQGQDIKLEQNLVTPTQKSAFSSDGPNNPNILKKEQLILSFLNEVSRIPVIDPGNARIFAEEVLKDPTAPEGILMRLARAITYSDVKETEKYLDNMSVFLKKLDLPKYIWDLGDETLESGEDSSNIRFLEALKKRGINPFDRNKQIEIRYGGTGLAETESQTNKPTLYIDDGSFSGLQILNILRVIGEKRSKSGNIFVFLGVTNVGKGLIELWSKPPHNINVQLKTMISSVIPAASDLLPIGDLLWWYQNSYYYEENFSPSHPGTQEQKDQYLSRNVDDKSQVLWFYRQKIGDKIMNNISDNFLSPVTAPYKNRPPLL